MSKKLNIVVDLTNWNEIWDFLDKYKEPTYIYIIGEVGGVEVKIGRSVNPGQRLKQIQTGYPNKLVLWGFCKEHDDFTEKQVHKLIKNSKIGGEWFYVSKEVWDIINRVKESSKLD